MILLREIKQIIDYKCKLKPSVKFNTYILVQQADTTAQQC